VERQITVAIADDSSEIRALVRMQLERDGRFEIVAEGTSLDEAVEALREHRPDVATLDLHMPGMETLDGLKEAQLASPLTDLFIVTGTYRPDKDPDLNRPELKGWMTKDDILTSLADRLAADR
jgi:chemotaxis response regulator CheB